MRQKNYKITGLIYLHGAGVFVQGLSGPPTVKMAWKPTRDLQYPGQVFYHYGFVFKNCDQVFLPKRLFTIRMRRSR